MNEELTSNIVCLAPGLSVVSVRVVIVVVVVVVVVVVRLLPTNSIVW